VSRPWFEESFGREYLEVYPHRGDEEASLQIPAVRELLGAHPPGPLLDLCCGTARHAVLLARDGFRVVGLDLSEALLEKARARLRVAAPAPPPGITLVRGDMRSLPFRGDSFRWIVNLFTSFGYFDEDDNLRALQEAGRVLTPDGRMLIDTLNPDRAVLSLQPRTVRQEGDLVIVEERSLDRERGRIDKTVAISGRTRSGSAIRRTFRESVALYPMPRMVSLLRDAGLGVVQAAGGFDGCSYTRDSERMILVTRKEKR